MSIKNETKVRASIKNIGGIDSTQISLDEGVNLLSGPNSTNKTSTLQALSAVLGSDEATVKSDAEEGRVELEVDGDTYYREVTRHGDSVHMEGKPYLDENTRTAELFAFLLDSNEARLAVEKDGDLRDVIMEPVDTDEIQNRISELVAERDSIQEQIEEIDSKRERLSELKEDRNELQAKLEEKRGELEEIAEEIDDVEEVSEVKERRNRLDELIETKSDIEDEIDRLDDRISSEKESIGSLEEDIKERRAKLEDATDGREKAVLKEKIEAKEGDIQRLQAKREEVSKVLSELQEVVEFNSRMLDKKERSEILGTEDGGKSSKTDMLLEDENEIVCWTCGSEVEASAVSETIEEIKGLRSKKNSRINEITEEIESLRREKEEFKEEIELIEGLKKEISRSEEELGRRRNQLEDLETELKEKESELSDVRSEIEEIESELKDAGSETLKAHKLKKEKEVEIESLEDRVEELDEKIRKIEDEIDELPRLEQEHKEVSEAITEARGRIDRLEEEAVESFNDHMDDLLEILGYENLERIWIEPRSRETKQGRRKVEERVFNLHVVRKDEEETVYEDDVSNLSESEREVAGLVFALSGYLAHEVHEELPFMILDSLGALDANRVADLLDYFEDHVSYLVAAVLPEVSEKIGDEYSTVDTV